MLLKRLLLKDVQFDIKPISLFSAANFSSSSYDGDLGIFTLYCRHICWMIPEPFLCWLAATQIAYSSSLDIFPVLNIVTVQSRSPNSFSPRWGLASVPLPLIGVFQYRKTDSWNFELGGYRFTDAYYLETRFSN